MTDYQNALWIPNNNFFSNTGKKSFIILHATAGGSSAQEIATYFQGTESSDNPVSSHYIVGKDGTVVQAIAEANGAYGNGVVTNPNWSGNPNLYTISIEHVKSTTDNSEPLTPAQQAASFALIKDICQRNGIGMHDADGTTGITGHFAIDPVNRARCPNTYPWSELWQYLNNGDETTMASIDINTPGVSTYFKASSDDKTWQCTNGNVIGGAILDFYKSFGGNGLCGLLHLGLPETSEIGGIPDKTGVTYQRFERGVLAYDPSRLIDRPPSASSSVYLMHITSGIGEDPRVTDLQGQVATLQSQLSANAQATKIAALEANMKQINVLSQAH